jgi:hypothetical protein
LGTQARPTGIDTNPEEFFGPFCKKEQSNQRLLFKKEAKAFVFLAAAQVSTCK